MDAAEDPPSQAAEKLDSWKEIAVFLGRGVRTVQRWERTEHLPVRRHLHLKRGSVYAFASELSDWQSARQLGFRARKRGPEANNMAIELDRLLGLTHRQKRLACELNQLLAIGKQLAHAGERSLKPHALPDGARSGRKNGRALPENPRA